MYFKNIKNLSLNIKNYSEAPALKSKFFFAARYAFDTVSSDIETTSIASVVFFFVVDFGHLWGRVKSVFVPEEKSFIPVELFSAIPPSGC